MKGKVFRQRVIFFELAEASMLAMKQEESSGNVADVSSVFKLFKTFRSGFEKVDVSLQTEILRNMVAEIEVRKTGVQVKIFGLSPGNVSNKLQGFEFSCSIGRSG